MTQEQLFPDEYRAYRVAPAKRAATLNWLIAGLEAAGCRIIVRPSGSSAPFRVIFQTPTGERMGAIFYLFTITCVATLNRPDDECRFQIKYGSKDGLLHEIWQDPTGLLTTVFLGIDPATGCWVAADPVLHNPTRMFISLEFKRHELEAARDKGWHAWERDSSIDADEPVEVLVGGKPERLFDLVRFERAAKGLDQGHRQLLATSRLDDALAPATSVHEMRVVPPIVQENRLHALAQEFGMSPDAILDLIQDAPRLKMAVRGWVAEDHLRRTLVTLRGVTDCERLNLEGKPDIRLRYNGKGPITIECKNVLRQTRADGLPRVDFQRTRASQGDPCSRYYRTNEFDVLAACLHAISEKWEFRYRIPGQMVPHEKCPGRLDHKVKVDDRWTDAERALKFVTGERQ